MKVARCLACAALWVAASGCIRSTFVLTDARYGGRPRTQPGVFIDRLPPFPYMSIGIIEVTAAAGTDLPAVMTEAASKGGEVGCDVVVERSIHPITSMIPNAGPPIAQAYYTHPTPMYTPAPTYAAAPPPSKREFICGLRLVPMPAPPPAPRPAPAPPAATPAPTP
jgi:hypothetical protein